MSKYEILVRILDELRKEAPANLKRYHYTGKDEEILNQLRARSFIHLYLKVKFGLLDFQEREHYVTDASQDGGIDAYYIASESKRIYFIQSKFRTTEKNFVSKNIELSELLQMDVDRITKGIDCDERENEYNGKIKQLIREISEIPDISRWNYEIILLANLSSSVSERQLRNLIGGFPTTVFDYEKAYRDLVFPVVQGTYYDLNELQISINLSNTTASNARVAYSVETECATCSITILFVPTIEIAKSLYKYKNSILKFNPRSYLELSRNTVNKAIKSTMTDLKTNEFALYNNGITLLSFRTDFSERIGQKDKAQLMISKPQIINGGQTAYTLSRLYEEKIQREEDPSALFKGKEVLLKIITFDSDPDLGIDDYIPLIEEISKATNQQSPVVEADRRSNEQIQIKLQNFLFDKYGYFYERKRGEFGDGIREKYILTDQIIKREDLIRMCYCCDLKPSEAWKSAIKQFGQQNFSQTLHDESRFVEYFFAYKCFEQISNLGKSKSKTTKFSEYGNALTYGKYAVVSACRVRYIDENSVEQAEDIVKDIMSKWLEFEDFIMKLPQNSNYFSLAGNRTQPVWNFNNYYKGKTVSQDIIDFFSKD